MTREQVTAVWDAHNDATSALVRYCHAGLENKAERHHAYLEAERQFYAAWQALDRAVDGLVEREKMRPAG